MQLLFMVERAVENLLKEVRMKHVVIELKLDCKKKCLSDDSPEDLMYHFKRSSDIKLHYAVDKLALSLFGGGKALRKHLISKMLQNNGDLFVLTYDGLNVRNDHVIDMHRAGITEDNVLFIKTWSLGYENFANSMFPKSA